MKAGTARLAARAMLLALLAAAVMTAPATARVFTGGKKANRVVGTKRADTMRLGGGNDRAGGRGGRDRILGGHGNDRLAGGAGVDRLSGNAGKDRLNGGGAADRLNGGAGKDRLKGGAGRDRLKGGAGADVLNSVDRRADKVVDGGGGNNTCTVDAADVAVARHCAKLTVVPAGGGGDGETTPTSGTAGALGISSGEGLSCASALPICSFTITGTGADSQLGVVTGGGGVTPGAGAVLAPDDAWEAHGLYGCTADGFLHVSIGEESVDVPVSCST
jgi:Ca2+-binding RTX toxin-like protein